MLPELRRALFTAASSLVSASAPLETFAIVLGSAFALTLLVVVVLALSRNVLPRVKYGRFLLEFRSIQRPTDESPKP